MKKLLAYFATLGLGTSLALSGAPTSTAAASFPAYIDPSADVVEPRSTDIQLVEATVPAGYTTGGEVPEEVGEQQQAEAFGDSSEVDGSVGPHVRRALEGATHVAAARVDLDAESALVAVTWDDPGIQPGMIAARILCNGVWSEWVELEVEAAAEPNETSSGRGGSEPILVFDTSSVEIVVSNHDGTTPAGLAITAISADQAAALTNRLVPDEGAEAPVAMNEDPSDPADGAPEPTAPPVVQDQPQSEPSGPDRLLDLEGAVEADNAALHALPTILSPDGSVFNTEFQGLQINTRKAWGAPAPTASPIPMAVKGAVVHYTLTTDNYSREQVAQQIRNINYYHQVTQGWGDIGYNLLVDRFGQVWEGRSGGLTNAIRGAHASGANFDTFGISFLGGLNGGVPSTTAFDSMAKAIAWKLSVHDVKNPQGRANIRHADGRFYQTPVISGHRDVGSTSCPGDNIYSRLPSLRSLVAGYQITAGPGGTLTPGWIESAGSWYYVGLDGAMKTGWVKDGPAWYYMDYYGVMQTGWVKANGVWYFLTPSGAMQTGWLTKDSKKYYLSSSGAMATGWTEIGGSNYLFALDGALRTQAGWVQVGSDWRYLTAKGSAQTDWSTVGGVRYFFGADGIMRTGWVENGATWYYLASSGALQTGWLTIASGRYFLGTDGSMQTGWLKEGTDWLYLTSSGAVAKGWQQVSGKWYLMNSAGLMQTGWQLAGGKWYYFASGGSMRTGWVRLAGTWYFLSENGPMQTGWVKDRGAWYYLAHTGAMLTGRQVIDGRASTFDSDGVWLGYAK